MKKKIITSVTSFFMLMIFVVTCFAFDQSKVNQVKQFVNSAAKYLKKTGDLNAFNDPKNTKFVKLPLYVFVYECKNKEVYLKAHPFAKKLIGKNIAFLKDKIGRFFALELCRAVQSHPEGTWASYYWFNPKTQKIEEKYTFIKQVPGTSYQVAAGLYESDFGGKVSLEKLNSQ